MEAKTVYLIRHGQIGLKNEQRRYIGQIDVPLSDAGRQQVEQLSAKLQNVKLDAVYCSDLSRGLDSAQLIAETQGLDPQVCPELREIAMGDWEGKAFADVAKLYPKWFKQRGNDIAYFRPPNGESFADCCNRVVPIFDRILQSPGTNLLIVGHAGVNRVLLCNLLGMPLANLFRIAQDYCCINIIVSGEFGLRVKCVNATDCLASPDLVNNATNESRKEN